MAATSTTETTASIIPPYERAVELKAFDEVLKALLIPESKISLAFSSTYKIVPPKQLTSSFEIPVKVRLRFDSKGTGVLSRNLAEEKDFSKTASLLIRNFGFEARDLTNLREKRDDQRLSVLSRNMQNLEKQFGKETLHGKDSNSELRAIKGQFAPFIHSKMFELSKYYTNAREILQDFNAYTTMEAQTFKETIIQNMDSIDQFQASFFMAMTSDHNRSELGIHDHSNEPSSLKLVPKVVP
ncbi:hypothetical protein Tco_0626544 [Tanacetum coccineum]|uniref:Uncharacterized protein n=1 Tax=Tanacetum coccineum TaxID=301880 RepID=A0ABQ4WK03_9ASTR